MDLKKASFWYFIASGLMVTAELVLSNLFSYFFALSDTANLLGLTPVEEAARLLILMALDAAIATFSFGTAFLIRKNEIRRSFFLTGIGATGSYFLYAGYQLYSGFTIISTSANIIAIIGGIFYAILGAFAIYLTTQLRTPLSQ